MTNKRSIIGWFVTILITFLFTLGVPGTFFFQFNDLVEQNPLVSLLALCLYELTLLFIGIFTKVWQQLEQRLIDRLTNKIDVSISYILSDYKRKYFKYLRHRHEIFDVKGLTVQGPFSLELDSVFVELSVAPKLFNS